MPFFPFQIVIAASAYAAAGRGGGGGRTAREPGRTSARRRRGPGHCVRRRVMADLRVRDLTMEYASGGYKVRPINSLDLDVKTGELVLLLGASGSGKTTLLSMLARLLTPTSGTVSFGDIDVTRLSGQALVDYRRSTVGIVFQAFNLIPSLTAARTSRSRRSRERSRSATPRRAPSSCSNRWDSATGSTTARPTCPAVSNSASRSRWALAHDPPLVLADEPTADLDYIQVDGVLRLLRDLAQPGRVVVVATHDERLLPLADHVVELTPRAADTARPPQRVELAPGAGAVRAGRPGRPRLRRRVGRRRDLPRARRRDRGARDRDPAGRLLR